MQALVFGRSLQRVVQALRLDDLEELLKRFFDPNEQNFAITPDTKLKFSEIIFDIELGSAALRADPNTAPILQALNLDILIDRPSRTNLLSSFQSASSREQVIANRLYWFVYYKVTAIVAVRAGFTALVVDSKTLVRRPNTDFLELAIDDYNGEPLTITRLEAILGSIGKLYEAISEYLGIEDRTAVIAYTDSGTTFTIGLEGLSKAIEAVRSLFHDAWRAIRFRKNERVERDLETLGQQLKVVTEIRQRVANGELDHETGARLEHLIDRRMVQLLEAGVLPGAVETSEEYDARQVLAAVRNTPLLGPGEQHPQDTPLNDEA